jgi:hypothetical protein
MPRLNQRVDGSGYYVTSIFTRRGVTRKVTYQTEDRAVQILIGKGIRSGDEIPRHLFFELLEEGLLYTHGSGPGEEITDDIVRPQRHSEEEQRDARRQIPIDVTDELLNEDGTFISFGAFKMRYGGPAGYTDDDLRTAFRTLNKRYQGTLGPQLQDILSSHYPISIKREADKLIVEFARR